MKKKGEYSEIIRVKLEILYFKKMVIFVCKFIINLKKLRMKAILSTLLNVVKILFPKSRWGNAIYLIIGFAVANYDNIAAFINQLLQAVK
jgi:hypothetical protein